MATADRLRPPRIEMALQRRAIVAIGRLQRRRLRGEFRQLLRGWRQEDRRHHLRDDGDGLLSRKGPGDPAAGADRGAIASAL